MSNFIHTAGTNGFIAAAPVVLNSSTEFSGVTNGSLVTISTAYSQSSYSNAQYGFIEFKIVTAGWTVTAGGNLCGWYLHSRDGGTNYEATNSAALPRPPDFIIPLFVGSIGTGYYYSPLVPLPYDTHKFYVQNNSGNTTSANNHVLSVLPVLDTFG